MAVNRLRVDSAGTTEGGHTRWKHVRQALLSPHVLACGVGFFFGNTAAQSFSVFAPSIIAAMGYSSTRAQLLSVGPYVSIFNPLESSVANYPGLCMSLFDPDRLAFRQIQEASGADHLLCSNWHCRILHARIPAGRPPICQVRRLVPRGHRTLFISATVARLGS